MLQSLLFAGGVEISRALSRIIDTAFAFQLIDKLFIRRNQLLAEMINRPQLGM
ncbi:hypothetical protein [Marinobacter mangrovi]|uniref:hypothetical protein n=1 Tax=Marinobacter mangrovi TaxID=2803918 RepID=UPI001932305D|nr:hypothetical protein [Marinobacter mangrovi]